MGGNKLTWFWSGVGKISLIRKVFGVRDVVCHTTYLQLTLAFKQTSETTRDIANIDQEFIAPTDERFVVYDSFGFEAADGRNETLTL